VATLGTAFVRGLQERGVAATLKHFPGLGLITRDEDSVVQTVALSLASLRRIDEAPFAAAIAAGADMVMTSTARYPALSPRAALLSRAITTVELRNRLGFAGVAITDDLDVSALRSVGAARLGVEATRAGNDLLLYAQSAANADAGFAAVLAAARRGTVSVTELRASVRRILALRARLGTAR
jgi:beta-N-acetylhexosaminidase